MKTSSLDPTKSTTFWFKSKEETQVVDVEYFSKVYVWSSITMSLESLQVNPLVSLLQNMESVSPVEVS